MTARSPSAIFLGGSVEDSAELRAQFDLLMEAKPREMPLAEAMRQAGDLLEAAVARHADALRALSRR